MGENEHHKVESHQAPSGSHQGAPRTLQTHVAEASKAFYKLLRAPRTLQAHVAEGLSRDEERDGEPDGGHHGHL